MRIHPKIFGIVVVPSNSNSGKNLCKLLGNFEEEEFVEDIKS